MKSFLTIALAMLASPSEAQSWHQSACKQALLSAFTTMEVVPESVGIRASTDGDYNDDHVRDAAMLLRSKGTNRKQSIGVCLSNVQVPVLINDAYVANHIATKAKGTRYNDYDRDTTSTYERDVITVNDGVCCGASYVLRGGVFVEIVDSD